MVTTNYFTTSGSTYACASDNGPATILRVGDIVVVPKKENEPSIGDIILVGKHYATIKWRKSGNEEVYAHTTLEPYVSNELIDIQPEPSLSELL